MSDPTQVDRDVTELLDAVLPFAEGQLRKRQGFLPFGASIKRESPGRSDLVALGEAEEAGEAVNLLKRIMLQEAAAGEIRAAAVCYDGRIQASAPEEASDAICVHVAIVGREPLDVFVPYRRALLRGYRFTEPIHRRGTWEGFGESAPAT